MPEKSITSLWELKPGDHIKKPVQFNKSQKKSVPCDHHYLVIGVVSSSEVLVIHNDGSSVKEEEAELDPGQITVIKYRCCWYSPNEAIERARSKVGEGYNVCCSNCEHFVTWAKTGVPISYQVLKAAAAGPAGAAGGALVGATVRFIVPIYGTIVGAVIGGSIGAAAGAAVCGAAGAKVGAAIGSIVPFVGTAVGTAVCAAVGGAVGLIGGVIAYFAS